MSKKYFKGGNKGFYMRLRLIDEFWDIIDSVCNLGAEIGLVDTFVMKKAYRLLVNYTGENRLYEGIDFDRHSPKQMEEAFELANASLNSWMSDYSDFVQLAGYEIKNPRKRRGNRKK